jgi:predicted RNA binding protein YcfA (HicA-like mRNA interferase family)
MTAREMIKMLFQDGWQVEYQKGSHIKLKHPTKVGAVTIPNHKGDLAPGTVASIKRQAQIK